MDNPHQTDGPGTSPPQPVNHRNSAMGLAGLVSLFAFLALAIPLAGDVTSPPRPDQIPMISAVPVERDIPSTAPPPVPDEISTAQSTPTWDRCVPITWFLRKGQGPTNAYALAERALNTISGITGLTFVYGGETSAPEGPSSASVANPAITIGWATAAEDPCLTGDVAGSGAVKWEYEGAVKRFTGGLALVDSGADLPADWSTTQSQGAILLHELGHALGMKHNDQESGSIMRTRLDYVEGPPDFSPQDVTVLRSLVDGSRC